MTDERAEMIEVIEKALHEWLRIRGDGRNHFEVIADVLLAQGYRRGGAEASVEVKPLEWTRKAPGHWTAARYSVMACQSRHWFGNGDDGFYHEAETCEAVKAAANEHHRARVLSQVTVLGPQRGGAEAGLREALAVWGQRVGEAEAERDAAYAAGRQSALDDLLARATDDEADAIRAAMARMGGG